MVVWRGRGGGAECGCAVLHAVLAAPVGSKPVRQLHVVQAGRLAAVTVAGCMVVLCGEASGSLQCAHDVQTCKVPRSMWLRFDYT